MPSSRGSRFLLWVDAVGGFLVCLGDGIVLGQAVPGSAVDVPILADLSRRQATIRRDEESYLLYPDRPVRINGNSIEGPVSLADGSLIDLAGAVVVKFRRPHPLSATARLDFVSRHRTQPAVDGILLMAESCVLGPLERSHIVCRDWPHDVMIYREGDELFCRGLGLIEIDGVEHDTGGRIGLNSRVTSADLSFSLEAI